MTAIQRTLARMNLSTAEAPQADISGELAKSALDFAHALQHADIPEVAKLRLALVTIDFINDAIRDERGIK